jgi:hypothetical protein
MGFNSYEFRLLRAKRHADKVKQDQIVKEIRHRNDKTDGDKKKFQYGKLLVAFIFIDCLFIQFFIMYMILKTNDTAHLSNLVGLIGTLVAQAVALISYNNKAKIENSSNGIVFETAMREMMMQQNSSSISSTTPNNMAIDDEEDAVG